MIPNKREENGIGFGLISIVLVTVSIVLILTMIKIYLSNQIYQKSKIVNKMSREVGALKAENIHLKQKVEALKYKSQVADTIFSLDDE